MKLDPDYGSYYRTLQSTADSAGLDPLTARSDSVDLTNDPISAVS